MTSISKLLTRSQVPGTGNQSYMPRPHLLIEFFLTPNRCHVCNEDFSTSLNWHVYIKETRLYPLQLITTLADPAF